MGIEIQSTYASIISINCFGVRQSCSRNGSISSVNHENFSPKIFDFSAWPNLILLRLLNLKKSKCKSSIVKKKMGKLMNFWTNRFAFRASCLVLRLFGCFSFDKSLIKLVGGWKKNRGELTQLKSFSLFQFLMWIAYHFVFEIHYTRN